MLGLTPQPQASARPGAARTSRALLRRGATNRLDQNRIHPTPRIIACNTCLAAIDHHTHPLDRNRSLRHVGRYNHLATRPRRHRPILRIWRKFTMQRQHLVTARLRHGLHRLNRFTNLKRARHKDQHIALDPLAHRSAKRRRRARPHRRRIAI